MRFLIKTVRELDVVAQMILKKLKAGQFVAIKGKMGAGKTTLIKFIGKHLGVKTLISSPSYVFLRTYKTKNPKIKNLHHFDAWRLDNPRKISTILDEEELITDHDLILVEWPEKIRFKRKPDLIIKIRKVQSSENRVIEVWR